MNTKTNDLNMVYQMAEISSVLVKQSRELKAEIMQLKNDKYYLQELLKFFKMAATL